MRRVYLCICIIITASLSVTVLNAREPLTFQQRVKAQEAIERVYYKHRIWPKANPGPKPSFEQMVPETVIEAKVRDYLKKSAALDEFWHRPITGKQLQAEMNRMARQTRDPAMLKELFQALHDDPYVIAECLARQLLARHRVASLFKDSKGDPQFLDKSNSCSSSSLAAWWKAARGRLVPSTPLTPDAAVYDLPRVNGLHAMSRLDGSVHEATSSICGDTWLRSNLGSAPSARGSHTAVWTGSEMIIWGGQGDLGYLNSGARYAPATDSWSPISSVGAPSPREEHTAVWTGSVMIVWGGDVINEATGNSNVTNTGGCYDPTTDTWIATSTSSGVPSARRYHTAVWTGSEMIVWGGSDGTSSLNSGGLYNPQTDTWRATSIVGNIPLPRDRHTAIWTGTRMIVWGGSHDGGYLNTGGIYDPSADTWTATSTDGAPSRRYGQTAVWTGSKMIIWGGYWGSPLNTGGVYSPSSDSWVATTTTGAPAGRDSHTAVWTGHEMIVWGGFNAYVEGFMKSGGRYNPETDSWALTTTTSETPTPRMYHTAIWTGSEMIIWGGQVNMGNYIGNGAKFSPDSNTWRAVSPGTAIPAPEFGYGAVWTGAEMLVWGGSASKDQTPGGRYDPATDTWTAMDVPTDISAARHGFSSVWTGSEMIVWGGYGSSGCLNTGGKYDPYTDSWISMGVNASTPAARANQTAVWTGSEMILWGGVDSAGDLPLGARYNPGNDTWREVATNNSPESSIGDVALWTGERMLIWGGADQNGNYLNTGGLYNPATDTWTATPIDGAVPTPRASFAWAWTGSEVVIWGGDGDTIFDSGAIFNPKTSNWRIMALTSDTPSARWGAAAVWTGSDVVIWGGDTGVLGKNAPRTGARYNPATNQWTPLPVEEDTPSGRSFPSAFWTGNCVLIWGGDSRDRNAQYSSYVNSGGLYVPPSLSKPVITGAVSNTCPQASVVLSTGTYAAYQWFINGAPIAGATAQTCEATLSGDYSVTVVNIDGCTAASDPQTVAIAFCTDTEVSPIGAPYSARIQMDPNSSTGYYLYFQKCDGATGYSCYEGSISALGSGSYDHGAGARCDMTVTDLGTGEMRAEITPSKGNHYYLVTAHSATAEGPSGFASSGVERDPSQNTCAP